MTKFANSWNWFKISAALLFMNKNTRGLSNTDEKGFKQRNARALLQREFTFNSAFVVYHELRC